MKFLELSIEKLRKENKKLYNKVIKEYNYDLVIFIAKGSYMIGQDIASLNNVPLLEIYATRKGGKLKKLVSPLLVLIPEKLKIALRKKEVNSTYHEKNSDRQISYDKEKWSKYKKCKKILLVDDSVDTGYSIQSTKEAIETFFKGATVKVAAINVFKKSEKVVKTDYYLYKDTMLKGPFSNDSKENKKYRELYLEWKQGE